MSPRQAVVLLASRGICTRHNARPGRTEACTGRVLAEVAKGSLQPPVKLLATRHGTAAAAVGKTFGALGLGFSVGNAIRGRLSTGGLTVPLGLASLCATANILLVAACLPHVDPAAAVTAYPEPSSSTMTTQLAEEPRFDEIHRHLRRCALIIAVYR